MNAEALALMYLRSIDAHRDSRWFEAPCLNPVVIDPDREFDAWLHYLFEHLRDSASATGHQSNGSDFDRPDLKAIRVISVAAPSITTKLSLVRLQDGLFVFVSGNGEARPVEITLWSEAIAMGFRKLSQAHPEHRWWAALGPPPGRRGMTKPLGEPIELDHLSLRDAQFGYSESFFTSLRGTSLIHHWIPVLVTGRSTGYNWEAAAHAAHRTLYELAAVLSLESGDYWTLRERPNPMVWGPPVLFESGGPLKRLTADEEAMRRRDIAPIDRQPLAKAWSELHREERLLRAHSAYYQGVGLFDDCPSFAVIAFVATIEEVGKLIISQERLAICPTCERPKFNSSRRLFQKTLERIRSKARAKELTNNLYKWRSATAHSGHLFGHETAFGNHPVGGGQLPLSVADTFYGAVRLRAQDASKDLLHLALSGSVALH